MARFLRSVPYLAVAFCIIFSSFSTIKAVNADYAFSQHTILENGMQVVVIPNHITPAVTHMVWYKAGAVDEPEGKSGIAHFLEHLMFKGTKNIAPGEFSKIIATLGGKDNAFTSKDYTAYHQTIAKEHLETVMHLEADRMQHLQLNIEEMRKERDVVLEERLARVGNIPRNILSEKMNKALFRNHPYSTPTIGWKDDIASYTLDDALAFYRQFYDPSNAILVVSGDITLEELLPLAQKHYGTIPTTPRIRAEFPTFIPLSSPILIEHRDEKVSNPEWMRYYSAPSHSTSDPKHCHATSVMTFLLGVGNTSRLYKSLVEEQKIAAYIGMYYDDIALGPSTLSIYALPSEGISIERLEQSIEDEISSFIEHGVTQEELERSKTIMVAESTYARDGLSKIARIYGEALATGLDTDYVEGWPKNISGITAHDVKTIAKNIFSNPSVTGILLPMETPQP